MSTARDNVEKLRGPFGVSELEKVEEASNSGWRLLGRDATLHAIIGQDALDLTESNVDQNGLTGVNQQGAPGENALAAGFNALALGARSISIGNGTIADTDEMTALGRHNLSDVAGVLLAIGNGDSLASRSNAFELYEDGRIHAPEQTIALHDHDKSLVTKEYLVESIANIPPPVTGAKKLNDLSDVDVETTFPSTNQVLTFNGNMWVPDGIDDPILEIKHTDIDNTGTSTPVNTKAGVAIESATMAIEIPSGAIDIDTYTGVFTYQNTYSTILGAQISTINGGAGYVISDQEIDISSLFHLTHEFTTSSVTIDDADAVFSILVWGIIEIDPFEGIILSLLITDATTFGMNEVTAEYLNVPAAPNEHLIYNASYLETEHNNYGYITMFDPFINVGESFSVSVKVSPLGTGNQQRCGSLGIMARNQIGLDVASIAIANRTTAGEAEDDKLVTTGTWYTLGFTYDHLTNIVTYYFNGVNYGWTSKTIEQEDINNYIKLIGINNAYTYGTRVQTAVAYNHVLTDYQMGTL